MNRDERIAEAVAYLIKWHDKGYKVGRADFAQRLGISVNRLTSYAPRIAAAVRKLDPTYEYHAGDSRVWITSDPVLIKSAADPRWRNATSRQQRSAAEYMTRARITREEHDWEIAMNAKFAVDASARVMELTSSRPE